MLSKHLGLALTEEQRARWVALITPAADDAGLPADPEFRSALLAYVEWGTRIALANSQPGAAPPPEAPVPHWGWGEAPPYHRLSRLRNLWRRCRSARSRSSATSPSTSSPPSCCCGPPTSRPTRARAAGPGRRETRALWDGLASTTPRPPATRCCAPRSPRCTRGWSPTTCSSSPARRRPSSRSPRRRWAPTTTPSCHAGLPVAATRSRAPPAPRSALVELEHERGWALDLDDVRRELRPDTRRDRRQLPAQPDRRAHRPRDPRRDSWRWPKRPAPTSSPTRSTAGSSTRRPRCFPARPSSRRARSASACMSKTFALPGLRIGWLACRDRELLAPHRGDQGLHDDLQQRARARSWRSSRCVAATRSWPAAAPSSTPTSAPRRLLRALGRRLRVGPPARRGDRLPAAAGRRGRSTTSRASSSTEEGVLMLPGSIYEHHGNHFRLGFGRRNMPEALGASSASRARGSSPARRCASAARRRSTARARGRRARRDHAWW